jgi:hypothetical protein
LRFADSGLHFHCTPSDHPGKEGQEKKGNNTKAGKEPKKKQDTNKPVKKAGNNMKSQK